MEEQAPRDDRPRTRWQALRVVARRVWTDAPLLVWGFVATGLVVAAVVGLAERDPWVTVRLQDEPGAPLRAGEEGLPTAPPPDAPDSPQHETEIEELLRIQAARTPEQEKDAQYWQYGAVLRWNEIARGLVAAHNTNPVVASRFYALLSVAQHDALVAAAAAQKTYGRLPPSTVDHRVEPLFEAEADSIYPSDHAVVAGASAAIIGFVFPAKQEVKAIDARAKEHEISRVRAGISRTSDVEVGDRLGRAVAARLIAQAKTDGAKTGGVNWRGDMPEGDDKWVSFESPPTPPVRPLWGKVRPWLLGSGDELRPPPPPALDSPEFAAALDEVRQISRTRTDEQLRIALLWADAQGSPTPPGHWNQIAADLVLRDFRSELHAARVFAFLNMAMADAGIACWDAKYTYWLLRPTQADPTITVPVGLPNFPSYPSGHSTFSGAAAAILGHFFPADAAELTRLASEASASRIYGGIHYRFDCDVGLAMGKAIGARAVSSELASAKSP